MVRALCYHLMIASVFIWALGAPVRAQEPDHIRGQITKFEASSMDVKTVDGETIHLIIPDGLTVIRLAKGSFTKLDFGVYVGTVAERLKGEEYSPLARDSMSWLHEGIELRIIDEELRGIAAGEQEWDLTPDTIMAHGWVDDIEERTLSIKYGPTQEEETDVEVGRDIPILKMSLGDMSLLKPGVYIFAGAQKNGGDEYEAIFIFAGEDGIVPSM